MRSKNVDATTAPCSVEGCERPVIVKARGWCGKHYQRWKAHGSPTFTLRDRDHAPTCSVEGCERPFRCKGLCESHWRKAYPQDPERPISDEIRARRDAYFWANVVQNEDGCWIWQRSLKRGYGQMRGYRRAASAHRFAYELLVGPIPPGMDIDHLCKVRACCNPGHLEVVTRAENLRRSDQRRPNNGGKRNAA